MATVSDCAQNIDPLKLVREGTSQAQRFAPALDPAYAPVDGRKPEHGIVFAQAYAEFLRYYDADNNAVDDWRRFFGADISARLGVAAVQDVEYYRAAIKECFDFLNNAQHDTNAQHPALKQHLGCLFSSIATLAKQLDALKDGLPAEIALKGVLQNLIQSQLAPAFKRLLAYYKADLELAPPHPLIADASPAIAILGSTTITFKTVYSAGLSRIWITDGPADWSAYINAISADASVYGSETTVFKRINHIATHNLFAAVFEQFLKVYARIVNEAKQALDATFRWDGHEPHYALFLAFLRLFEYARSETNTLTQRHLDFYYRDILRLKEKPAEPAHVHLLAELARQAEVHEFKAGELFKAGKDDRGKDAFFTNDRDFAANQAKVAGLKTLYRHKSTPGENLPFAGGRLFASLKADSGDGLGAPIISEDQSWHPFCNKVYENGKLVRIAMPPAEIGFGIASHYLWMAEGGRTIILDFSVAGGFAGLLSERKHAVVCLLTSAEGWLEKTPESFMSQNGGLRLSIELSGADAAVTPYNAKTHGYHFMTGMPVLLVKLRHLETEEYLYPALQDAVIQTIGLEVKVSGLKTLAVSNDFGPVDVSKPFQPFGASPQANSALIIGAKEIFQKNLAAAAIHIQWQTKPQSYDATVNIETHYLQAGSWQPSDIEAQDIAAGPSLLQLSPVPELNTAVIDAPDFSKSEHYNTASRHGYIRLKINRDFGQREYEQALIAYIKRVTDRNPNNDGTKPVPPSGPFISELKLDYTAQQTIVLDSSDKTDFEKRRGCFFHLSPFGHAEQHAYLKSSLPGDKTNAADKRVFLLPPFSHLDPADSQLQAKSPIPHEAEFYIGLAGLKPLQNLSLLLQVAEGTADPLALNPKIHWSYLRSNEWIGFAARAVEDGTGGLLNSGIVTFALPGDATADHTLLPSGMHWIRAAAASASDAVCRLRLVAAQALQATFSERGNDPAFMAKALPAGTIGKLEQPDAGVKQLSQPFPSFGGRGAERPEDFYRRISERLRHKDRGIALWDYEHLILEAFPQIYKAKCLNHTQYEPNSNGTGIYRELAPGHVTVVTIPNQQFQHLRDPLRPYTSLGLLSEIESFMRKRLSCFVQLHVKNPQFEAVHVACNVRFREGSDVAFHLNKLQQAIIRFLSPWAFTDAASPSFGGKIYQSVLINFIEDQPYVDYATEFNLSHRYLKPDPQGVEQPVSVSGLTEIQGSKAISILVSAAEHDIKPILGAAGIAPHETCPCEP